MPRDTYAGAAQSLHDSKEKVDRGEEDRKNRMRKRERKNTVRTDEQSKERRRKSEQRDG